VIEIQTQARRIHL